MEKQTDYSRVSVIPMEVRIKPISCAFWLYFGFAINGKVERLQRSCRNEFYSRYEDQTLAEEREELSDYENLHNSFRPHTALDYLSPFEYYKHIQESTFSLSQM